nr:PREDICTED: heat shock factor protein 2-like [Phalacrocorax carbo]
MNPTDHITNTKMETKGIETTKNNAGPAASQETQVSKPKSDKQLIQYTAFPLLAFLDGNPGSAIESGSSTAETPSSVDKPLEVDELLESSLDPEPTQSKLVRLGPGRNGGGARPRSSIYVNLPRHPWTQTCPSWITDVMGTLYIVMETNYLFRILFGI